MHFTIQTHLGVALLAIVMVVSEMPAALLHKGKANPWSGMRCIWNSLKKSEKDHLFSNYIL